MKKLIIRLLTIMSLFTGCGSKKTESVSVIGGADGPTSVFIAGKLGSNTGIITIGIIAAVILLVVVIIYFKKKK